MNMFDACKVKSIEYDAAGNVIRFSGQNCEEPRIHGKQLQKSETSSYQKHDSLARDIAV